MTKMFSDKPASEWAMTLSNIDMPTDYLMTFTAIVGTVGSLLLPWFFIDVVVGYLAPIVI